jgi:tryptophanyl-tRNA synthetase
MTKKPKVFSGIQPSGTIHIGNYLGAIKNWAGMLDDYDCVFGIVDLHAMTITYDPNQMQQRIFDAACVNMACGLDPERCILFVQSHVPQVTELAWVFTTLTPMGLAGRMTQFKDKSEQHADNVNVGLFTYPILQAADILLYLGEYVPVGEDQVQHIEFSRDVARKFNNTYGEYFPEPQAKLTQAARIMGLDGQHKMSKSLDNYIAVTESPEEVWAKLRTAYTDPARLRRSDPGNPDVCNIFSLHQIYSTPDEIAMVDRECRTAGIGCIDCKKILARHIDAQNAPIRERYHALVADPDHVWELLHDGAARARVIAEKVMADVYRLTGLR